MNFLFYLFCGILLKSEECKVLPFATSCFNKGHELSAFLVDTACGSIPVMFMYLSLLEFLATLSKVT